MSKFSRPTFPRADALRALAFLGIAAGSLSGCVTDYASNDGVAFIDYHERYPIVLAEAPTSLDVYPVGGRLDALSAAKVRGFAERYRGFGSGRMVILAPAGTREANRAIVGEIRRTLYASGMRGYVTVGTYRVFDGTIANPVRLVFRGLKAEVRSPCGVWPSDVASASSIQGWKNESYENFGCATQSTLAAEIDDPRDVVQQRASSPPDEEMRLRAIGAVRKGQDPGTDWKTQNTAIGTVGGG
jgi:pilus assembly protein CpaD